MAIFIPSYLKSLQTGQLQNKISVFHEKMNSCEICPRKCGVNRNKNETGVCMIGKDVMISSYGPHYGEEKPLVGAYGSGTIFFSGCNLLCNFCQNFAISHELSGIKMTCDELADIMIHLQESGCKNINFVSPSHVVPHIPEAVISGIKKGLNIPLIYNTSAYDSIETIQLLNGVIDIYMPDFKFWKEESSNLTCSANNYPEIAKEVIKEMYRQCGNLAFDEKGNAISGLLIRHLVMPNDFSGSKQILKFIADEISAECFVNIMSQYRPEGIAFNINEISRSLKQFEYHEVLSYAKEIGLKNFL